MRYISFGGFLLFLFTYACNNGPVSDNTKAYSSALAEERKQKDNEFAAGKNSPFASLDAEFEGLKYFAPDLNWRFAVKLTEAKGKTEREVTDSKGEIRHYQVFGYFEFTAKGERYRLPVFLEAENPDILFLMFRDLSNGKETYEGGRYLEIHNLGRNESYELDFNRSFNPYCHYNHSYSCPLVPKDCFLNLKVEAGEKKYKD